MASTCPKCHKAIDNDSVCCADIKYAWKCKSCGKLSTGFALPYGRCYLCGGEIAVVEGYAGARPELVSIIQEAVQYEVDMFHFYCAAARQTTDAILKAVLEELSRKEEDHLSELDEKYHLHLNPDLRSLPAQQEKILEEWIFQGVDFRNDEGHVLKVYDQAIAMERRTRDRFLEHANAFPDGPQKDMYRELAAEEEDHVAMLETEREQFLNR